MKKLLLIVVSIILFCTSGLTAQDMPLLAVPNISAVGVSETLASTSRNMVETALIKTNKFTVLSYTDMEEILEAQAFSLSGCTDESCAIEIGELLAADNIVVGDLSQVGEAMVLSIRLVNVTSGHTVSGEVVTIPELGTMQENIFQAAFALAGMKYVGGSAVVEKGTVYVKAPNEIRLNVTLDGKSYGMTPVLIEDIDFGVHLLEAQAGSYFFSTELSIVSKDITEVFADVQQLKGSLFLMIEPYDAEGWELYVDGIRYEDGLIKDLPIGDHKVDISGGGWYYSGSAAVEADTTSKMTLMLEKAGALHFFGPEGIIVELNMPGGEMIFGERVKKPVYLPAGSYKYRIIHDDYEENTGTISVTQGQIVEIRPEWEHNESWFIREQISKLKMTLPEAEKKKSKMMPLFWSFTGAGGTASLLSGVSEAVVQISAKMLSDTHEIYLTATEPAAVKVLGDSINDYERSINTWREVRNWSLIGGGSSLLIAGIIYLCTPSPENIRARITNLEEGLK